jgi:hypothetical protein
MSKNRCPRCGSDDIEIYEDEVFMLGKREPVKVIKNLHCGTCKGIPEKYKEICIW